MGPIFYKYNKEPTNSTGNYYGPYNRRLEIHVDRVSGHVQVEGEHVAQKHLQQRLGGGA